jgi:hypothetical protein
MKYLISFLGVGCLVVGIIGFSLRSRGIEITSGAMLLACIILCIFDAFIAADRGVAGKQTFNWISSSRFARKPNDRLQNIERE